MAFNLNHVHLKTRDPAATIRFYIENFGATLKAKTDTGFNLDLHGLQLNVTDLNAAQKCAAMSPPPSFNRAKAGSETLLITNPSTFCGQPEILNASR